MLVMYISLNKPDNMKATAKQTYTDVSTSAIATLISDSPNPIFILAEDRETIVSWNQAGMNGQADYDLAGKSINRILFNYNIADSDSPVYYRDNWYKAEIKSFIYFDTEYVKVTLKLFSHHLSEETLETTHDLIAILLHRFRSPLTAIQGYSDMMSMATDNDKKRRQKYLDKISTGTKHISGILDEFESLLIDEEEDRSDMIKVSSLLSELISTRNEESAGERIRFHAPENACILSSRKRLLTVLTLLIDNALDHSADPSSPIMISVKNPHTIEISNRGKRISSEDAKSIFKPFTTSRSDKTGIGLSLAQIVANKMGAYIHLKSGEEKNITFVLHLPPKYMTVLNS